MIIKRSGKSLKQLVNEYGLSSNLFRLQVIKDSRLLGKTIIDFGFNFVPQIIGF